MESWLASLRSGMRGRSWLVKKVCSLGKKFEKVAVLDCPQVFCMTSTQLNAHIWLLLQGLPPLREVKDIFKSFLKFDRLIGWGRLTKEGYTGA